MKKEIEEILDRENKSLASIQKRLLAFLIDEIIISILIIFIIWDKVKGASSNEEMIYIVQSFIIEMFIIKVIYQSFFINIYGASIGKILTKTKVISLKTLDKPNLFDSINRAFFRAINDFIFYIGFFIAIFNDEKQSLHDKTANTIVINA